MGDQVLNFFWPRTHNPSPNGLTRFGRVLHWIAAGIFLLLFVPGVAWLGLSLFQFVTDERSLSYDRSYVTRYWPNSLYLGLMLSGFGAFFYLAGRALRYIFSGE